jgi:DNA topoisomerase I, bacterial
MTELVIVESPGKIKKISHILGSNYKVMASIGHIREIANEGPDQLGFTPPDFKPHYVNDPEKNQVIGNLIVAAKQASDVFLASDPDREGEAIAWHVAEALKLKNPKRITFNGITEGLVKEAIENPRQIDMNLVHAQETRSVLDKLFGFKVTAALRDKIGYLTAGRVQTVAVHLVVDREKEITTFKPLEHYTVDLDLGGWNATLDIHTVTDAEYLTDKTLAERIVQNVKSTTVTAFDDKDKPRLPEPPFTTSSLQIVASAKLGFSPKKTMDLAQKLYEQGTITYHRTDAPHFVAEGLEEIHAFLTANGLPITATPRKWKSKEGAQEGHEAIRPTHIADEVNGETPDQKALYSLIRKRSIMSEMADAIYAVRTIALEATFEDKKLNFKASGRVLKTPGWLAFDDQSSDDNNEDEPNVKIPDQTVGTAIPVVKANVVTKTTKPKTRFTDATLVREMEKRGIGRPSTYASIIEKIHQYKYVTEIKKYLKPTETGETLIAATTGTFAFCDYDYTKKLEENLDDVAAGKMEFKDVVGNEYETLEQNLQAFNNAKTTVLNPCPNCGRPMIRRKGKDGGFYWMCSGYSDGCKTSLPDDHGKMGTRKTPELTEFKCLKCGKPLIHRTGKSKKSGKNYDFFACSGYPDCNESYDNDHGKPKYEKEQSK